MGDIQHTNSIMYPLPTLVDVHMHNRVKLDHISLDKYRQKD